ncbi:MAG TPA: helix-turn-helix transcriptional regulator [Kofleriaceae bacterium]|nr:helix-turn-helix transcriptional regulator [Kofleriaceae bacterium]
MSPSGTDYHGSTVQACAVDDLALVETRHAAHQVVAPHAHEASTLCVPLAGGFDELAGRVRLGVVAPLVLVRAASERHADRFGACDAHCFNVVVGRRWLARHGLEAPPWSGVQLVGGEAAYLARKLHREFRGDGNPLVLQGLLLTLLGELGRRRRRAGPPPSWLTRVEALLRASCEAPLELAQVAAAAGVHPAHLAREFRRHRRTTVGEYVRRLRIERACAQIDAGASLASVASATGFADQSHFGRVFRRLVGVTPGEYRRARASGSRTSRSC